jgi:UDP-N-acetyl-D-glucosamine dehydrogenase
MERARSVVCVQGLGFVGFAMATAVAHARDAAGNPYFDVIGVDLPTAEGRAKVDAINSGKLPVESTDEELAAAFEQARRRGNLRASTDPAVYEQADITVVDVHLDVRRDGPEPDVCFDGFRAAIRTLGERMRPGSLIVVETTVPPGTCERVAAPELAAALRGRGLAKDAILLAHSYERVMPGREYFRSIVRFWRVYAGTTDASAAACADFLSKVIDVERFPLTRLASTTASETGKVLENSYRALNIAFMQEWGDFAEAAGIDLFEVIEAIRLRPTHSNMRYPGFGVGGYCLTKDPLLAGIAARQLFGFRDLRFCFSEMAVGVNDRMPLHTLSAIRRGLGGLSGKKLLLLGVSYRQDVADTRFSPSEILVRAAEAEGAQVACHDPLVRYWSELKRSLPAALPPPEADAVVFATAHDEYRELDLESWLGQARPLVVDANHVLTASQKAALAELDCPMAAIGKGC